MKFSILILFLFSTSIFSKTLSPVQERLRRAEIDKNNYYATKKLERETKIRKIEEVLPEAQNNLNETIGPLKKAQKAVDENVDLSEIKRIKKELLEARAMRNQVHNMFSDYYERGGKLENDGELDSALRFSNTQFYDLIDRKNEVENELSKNPYIKARNLAKWKFEGKQRRLEELKKMITNLKKEQEDENQYRQDTYRIRGLLSKIAKDKSKPITLSDGLRPIYEKKMEYRKQFAYPSEDAAELSSLRFKAMFLMDQIYKNNMSEKDKKIAFTIVRTWLSNMTSRDEGPTTIFMFGIQGAIDPKFSKHSIWGGSFEEETAHLLNGSSMTLANLLVRQEKGGKGAVGVKKAREVLSRGGTNTQADLTWKFHNPYVGISLVDRFQLRILQGGASLQDAQKLVAEKSSIERNCTSYKSGKEIICNGDKFLLSSGKKQISSNQGIFAEVFADYFSSIASQSRAERMAYYNVRVQRDRIGIEIEEVLAYSEQENVSQTEVMNRVYQKGNAVVHCKNLTRRDYLKQIPAYVICDGQKYISNN